MIRYRVESALMSLQRISISTLFADTFDSAALDGALGDAPAPRLPWQWYVQFSRRIRTEHLGSAPDRQSAAVKNARRLAQRLGKRTWYGLLLGLRDSKSIVTLERTARRCLFQARVSDINALVPHCSGAEVEWLVGLEERNEVAQATAIARALSKQIETAASIAEAEHVFKSVAADGRTDPFHYAALMKVYVRHRYMLGAERILERMKDEGAVANEVIWTILISGYASEDVGAAEDALVRMVASGVQPNEVTWTTLLSAYASAHRPDDAERVLERMLAGGCRPNKITLTRLVKSYGDAGRPADAERVFNQLVSAELADQLAWTTLLEAFAVAGNTVDAERIIVRMNEVGFAPNAYAWNMLAMAYAASDDAGAAVNIVQRLMDRGEEVHERSWRALSRLDKGITVTWCHTLLETLRQRGESPNASHWHLLLKSQGQAHPYDAEATLEEMRAAGIEPSLATWTILLQSFASHSRPQEAERVLNRMLEAGLPPEEFQWAVLLRAYAEAFLPRDVERILDLMRKHGAEPTAQHWTLLIRAYAGVGNTEAAEEAFSRMEAAGHQPMEYAWSSLLNAYANARDEPGARAVDERMRAAGLQATAVSEATLMKAFARTGSDESAEKLLVEALKHDHASKHLVGAYVESICRAQGPAEAERRLGIHSSGYPMDNDIVQSAFDVLATWYAREGQTQEVVRLRDALLDRGIPLTTYTAAATRRVLLQSGTVRETSPGVEEGWHWLREVLQDVVHEISPLVGDIGFHLERGIESGDNVQFEKVRTATAALRERLQLYRALTASGDSDEIFDATAAVVEVHRLLQTSIEEAGVTVQIVTSEGGDPRSLPIRGSAFLFQLALRALVNNSLFALRSPDIFPAKRLITISILEGGRGTERSVDIFVRDRGPGIPDAIRAKIFERGFTTKEGRGLGLGLAMASNVATSMGGRLQLVEGTTDGAEFWLRFPRADWKEEEGYQT